MSELLDLTFLTLITLNLDKYDPPVGKQNTRAMGIGQHWLGLLLAPPGSIGLHKIQPEVFLLIND